MKRFSILLAAAAFAAMPLEAQAQEIRIARQFSMGYMQFNVMEHEKLLEKHAAALGLKDVKIVWATFNGPDAMNNALISDSIDIVAGGVPGLLTLWNRTHGTANEGKGIWALGLKDVKIVWATFNGPDAMNNALISDSIDIVAGGVPGLLTLWNRTHGTANEVKGISALSSQPFLLNTRSENIKSIADLKDSDRIAVPAVKVSVQAVTLQMAAAKLFGEKNFGKLDPLTVSMSPPDSTIALLTGTGEINNVFGVPPFQFQQLEKPGVRTILNSFDIMDGPHTFTVAWTSARFRDKNPVLYKALIAALKEATEIVDKDRQKAAGYWT